MSKKAKVQANLHWKIKGNQSSSLTSTRVTERGDAQFGTIPPIDSELQ
jgi:hypothetical protein